MAGSLKSPSPSSQISVPRLLLYRNLELAQEGVSAWFSLYAEDVGQHHRPEQVAHCVVKLICNRGQTGVTP